MCTEYDGPFGAEITDVPPVELPPIREMTPQEWGEYCRLMNELVEAGG